jgi:hypothetical protein
VGVSRALKKKWLRKCAYVHGGEEARVCVCLDRSLGEESVGSVDASVVSVLAETTGESRSGERLKAWALAGSLGRKGNLRGFRQS